MKRGTLLLILQYYYYFLNSLLRSFSWYVYADEMKQSFSRGTYIMCSIGNVKGADWFDSFILQQI